MVGWEIIFLVGRPILGGQTVSLKNGIGYLKEPLIVCCLNTSPFLFCQRHPFCPHGGKMNVNRTGNEVMDEEDDGAEF